MLGAARVFKGTDLVGVTQGQADVVPAVEQALLAEGVDVETVRFPIRAGNGLRGQVDDQARRLAEGGARLFLPMPVLFEVFKWLLFQAGPKAAREGLAKVEEGAVVVPFTLEDLEEVRLLLARLPGWGGTLEDAGVALLALRLGAPVWTLNYRDLGAFPALRFWTP